VDEVALYDLDRSAVQSFVEMGFTQSRIVEDMRRLNIRRVDSDDARERLLQALLK
jgi:hypothetical protein